MTTFETPGEVTLRVSLGGGEVSIAATDDPCVTVDAVALRDDEVTRGALANLRVEHAERAGRHEVVVEVPKGRGGLRALGRGPAVGLNIRCPRDADLDLSTSSAGLDARGPLGEVRARTASGDLLIESAASCDVSSASGDVEIRSASADVRLKTASGDGIVGIAGGPVTANLVSGDLIVEDARGAVVVNSVSGDVRAFRVANDVRVKSVSGDVEIGVRDGLKLWIDASSVSGSMSSELDVAHERPGGDGEVVELYARTVSGDVHIGRATASPS